MPLKSDDVMVEPILFPCILAMGGRVSLTTKREAERFLIKAQVHDNRYLLKDGVTEQFKISFFIDRTGLFREVREICIRRQWTKSIAWFYDFALRECEICSGVRLSVSDLLARADSLTTKHPSRTRQFRQYLRKLPGDAPFDEHRFREFWDQYGYALAPDEWQQQLP